MDALHAAVRSFCAARGWDRYHTPQTLVLGIMTEAAGLLQDFHFLDPEEQVAPFDDPISREAVEDECAAQCAFGCSGVYEVIHRRCEHGGGGHCWDFFIYIVFLRPSNK